MILAIDPSSTCTGWAILHDDGSANGAPASMGILRMRGEGIIDRLREIHDDIAALVSEGMRPDITAVVIERPETARIPAGKFAKQSITSIASYGAAFGVAYSRLIEQFPGRPLYTPTPSEWVGRGAGVPSSKGDPHKVRRVRWAETVWRLERGHLGAMSTAGNVADALFIARWGMSRLRAEAAVRRSA